jgi:hypothetical protein
MTRVPTREDEMPRGHNPPCTQHVWSRSSWVRRSCHDGTRMIVDCDRCPAVKVTITYWMPDGPDRTTEVIVHPPMIEHGDTWNDAREAMHSLCLRLDPKLGSSADGHPVGCAGDPMFVMGLLGPIEIARKVGIREALDAVDEVTASLPAGVRQRIEEIRRTLEARDAEGRRVR